MSSTRLSLGKLWLVALMLSAAGCTKGGMGLQKTTLLEARKGFQTKASGSSGGDAVPNPPADVFRLVTYSSPVGNLPAYVTPDPKDGKQHPAMIWITGGDCNSIGEGCWERGSWDNDQSGTVIREAGIVMLFPSLRGGNTNPGIKESFLGEVDDVLAAREFLVQQSYVDPQRIYLGGHSTGGTLVMLVAECSDKFRTVFSFGPVEDVSGYEPKYVTFNTSDRRETRLRSPGYWMEEIKTPTFVIEGNREGNIDSLRAMAKLTKNPQIQFVQVAGANHFNVLAPISKLIAKKVLNDTGSESRMLFSDQEIARAMTEGPPASWKKPKGVDTLPPQKEKVRNVPPPTSPPVPVTSPHIPPQPGPGPKFPNRGMPNVNRLPPQPLQPTNRLRRRRED